MDAEALGWKRGREFLQQSRIQETTFTEYQAIGHVDAKQRYKRQKTRDAYLLGWWHAGEQNIILFKPDDKNIYAMQQRINGVLTSLGRATIDLEQFLDWRSSDLKIQGYLQNAYQAINQAQNYLDLLSGILKQEAKR